MIENDRVFTDYCDVKTNWGPLAVFRPAPHERMGIRRTLAMSVLLGFLFGVPGSVFLSLVGRLVHRPYPSLLGMPLALSVAYFAIAWLTFAPAWNRRAVRLSGTSKR